MKLGPPTSFLLKSAPSTGRTLSVSSLAFLFRSSTYLLSLYIVLCHTIWVFLVYIFWTGIPDHQHYTICFFKHDCRTFTFSCIYFFLVFSFPFYFFNWILHFIFGTVSLLSDSIVSWAFLRDTIWNLISTTNGDASVRFSCFAIWVTASVAVGSTSSSLPSWDFFFLFLFVEGVSWAQVALVSTLEAPRLPTSTCTISSPLNIFRATFRSYSWSLEPGPPKFSVSGFVEPPSVYLNYIYFPHLAQ